MSAARPSALPDQRASARAAGLRRKRAVGLFVAALAVSAGGDAWAGCSPGTAGPRDYVCTGAIGTTLLTNTASVAMVGSTASGQVKLGFTGGGDANFSMDAASSIAAASGDALTLVTSNGNVGVITPSGSGINGPITARAGAAIVAGASGVGHNVNIVTGSGAVLTASSGGVIASADNAGAVNLTLGGKITVSAGPGVSATAVDGAVNIASTAAISGGVYGISAQTSGAGPIAINAGAAVASSMGSAVSAIAGGAGNVSVYAAGALTGAASGAAYGALGRSASGNVTITTLGAVSAASGVAAQTAGAGAIAITTGSAVAAALGDGVSATTVDGQASAQIGPGGVTAANNGVMMQATGLGAVTIATHGNVSGTHAVGVGASTASGAIQIDMDAGVFVSGGTAGLAVSTQSGAATVNANGTISGVGGAAGVSVDVNSGSLALNNSGTIQSSGAAINVRSGAALVQNTGVIAGAIASAAGTIVTLNNNGTWSNAAGSSLGYLNNNGVLTMGPAGGAPGVLTITGNATFGAGSTLNMRVAPAGGSDSIVVAGQTTIAGGLLNLSGATGAYTKGTVYTLINSAGGVTGNFSAVASGLSSYAGYLTSDANDIYLTILNRDFRPLALSRNQLAVANAVYLGSGVLASGPGAQMLTALNAAPTGAVPAALAQMSGDGVVTGAANAALLAGHLFTSALQDQETLWRSDARDVNSITLSEPFAYAPQRAPGEKWPVSRQRYAPPPPPAQRTWRVWASGFGGQQNLQGDQNAGSSNQATTTVGGAMGIDYQLGQSMLLGVAAGYSSSAFSASATGVTGTANGLHVGAYTGFRVGGFYGDASIAYGGYSNTAKRTVAPIGNASGEMDTSNFASEEVRTRIEIGRKIGVESMAITPFTAVEIAHIHTRPFVESSVTFAGGPGLFGLSYGSQGVSSVPTFIGVKTESRIEMGGSVLTPWISIAWRHEWSASLSQTASLVSLPMASFVAIGARPARDALEIRTGAELQVTRTAALFATFEGEFLSKTPVYTGKGGVRIGW